MSRVIGECAKHPGQNMVNCPWCQLEHFQVNKHKIVKKEEPMKTIRINYDDQVDDSAYKVIGVVNELLMKHHLKFEIEDDGQPHDGFNLLNITLKED